MNNRMVDYYVKGLPFDSRQAIFDALEKINVSTVEKLLEKNEDYPRYRSLYYDDADIASQLAKSAKRFRAVNGLMAENHRPPLFPDPDDTFASAQRYVALMRQYRQKETDSDYPSSLTDFNLRRPHISVLEEIMGCTWDEYVPESYSDPV